MFFLFCFFDIIIILTWNMAFNEPTREDAEVHLVFTKKKKYKQQQQKQSSKMRRYI